MPETLPPFSGDDPTCLKCGHVGASTEFVGQTTCTHGGWNMRQPHGDRLHRACLRCSYSWDEAVVGEIPTVEPAPTTVDVYGDDTSWMLPLIDQYANGQRVTLPEHAVSYSANFNRLDLFASTFSVHLEDGSTLTRKWSVLP